MGFSGGGANILKPHTHDSNIVQDGGNLDFKNITQGDLSAGSVTYSNGSHLQELVKPVTPANEVLTFATSATAPSWNSAASFLELLDVHTATGTESTYTLTKDISFDDYSNILVIFQGGATDALALQGVLNGSTSGNHHYTMEYSDGSSITDSWVQDDTSFQYADANLITAGAAGIYAYIEFYMNGVDDKYAFYRSYSRSYPQLRWERHLGVDSVAGQTGDISSITTNTSTSTWIAGSRICTYGFKTAL